MKRIRKFLGSLKLSFLLLVALLGVIVQKAILAQRYFISPDPEEIPVVVRWFDSLGVGSIEQLNTVFWGILGCLLVNLCFAVPGMIKRGQVKRKGLARYKSIDALQKLTNTYEIAVPTYSKDNVAVFFQRKGFRFFEEETSQGHDYRFFAVKRDIGQWGTILFHLTFLLFFIGGIASYLTRFTGYFELAPGEIFVERYENYIQKTPQPLLFHSDSQVSFVLKRIDLSYWKPGEVKQRASELTVMDDDGTSLGIQNVSVNNPYTLNNIKLYQGARHGFIAGINVTDTENNEAKGSIRFLLSKKKDPELITWVRLPGTMLDLKLELFTDMVRRIQGLENFYSSSFSGSLMKVSSVERGRPLQYHGIVFGGGTIEFEGLAMKFESLKPFTSFIVTRDYGVPAIYAGFALLLVSLCTMYFWVPKRYWITVRKEGDVFKVFIGGSTDKYKEAFKEQFGRFAQEFEQGVKA